MISASEYRRELRSKQAGIESVIDDAIRMAALFGRHRVTINLLSGWTRTDVDEVLVKYRAAGWDAAIRFDQREGDYIDLVAEAK